jgi:hypothetical protein
MHWMSSVRLLPLSYMVCTLVLCKMGEGDLVGILPCLNLCVQFKILGHISCFDTVTIKMMCTAGLVQL